MEDSETILVNDNISQWNASEPSNYMMIAQGVAIPTIACLGIVGNSLNLVVLSTARGRRMASRSCLFALAVADLLFLLFGTFEVASEPFLATPHAFRDFYYSSVLVCRMTSSASLKSSILFVMVFNLERYISVCHPMQMHKMFKGSVERNLLLFSACFCGLLSMHYPISYVVDDVDGRMIHYRGPNYKVLEDVINYFDLVVFNLVPIAVLAFLNLKLITTLRRVARKENDSLRQTMIGHKVNKPSLFAANSILFAVIVLFLVCYGPQIPARVLTDVYGVYSPVLKVYVAMSQQLVFLNASLNFCLYCLVSKRYRSILRYLAQRMQALLRCEEELQCCARMQSLSSRDYVMNIQYDDNSDND